MEIHTAAAESLQSCPTLCDPIDGSPPGSPVPGILQARTLEWVVISFSNAGKWKVKVKSLSPVWLLATPWTPAHQAPSSMGFSRQEYWSGRETLKLDPEVRGVPWCTGRGWGILWVKNSFGQFRKLNVVWKPGSLREHNINTTSYIILQLLFLGIGNPGGTPQFGQKLVLHLYN